MPAHVEPLAALGVENGQFRAVFPLTPPNSYGRL